MFKELENDEFRNFRNYEVLCEFPKISYVECDYRDKQAEGLRQMYGHTYNVRNEEINVFNANMSDKVKEIFKKSCLKKLEVFNYILGKDEENKDFDKEERELIKELQTKDFIIKNKTAIEVVKNIWQNRDNIEVLDNIALQIEQSMRKKEV